jgi:hypothetical protein
VKAVGYKFNFLKRQHEIKKLEVRQNTVTIKCALWNMLEGKTNYDYRVGGM